MSEPQSNEISQYKLPIKRVEEMKNYLPVQKEQFWSLEEIRAGDESGTTETDSATDPKGGGYATSQTKSGRSKWPVKRS